VKIDFGKSFTPGWRVPQPLTTMRRGYSACPGRSRRFRKYSPVCLSKWRRDFHRPGAALSRVRRDKQLAKMRPAAWAAKRAEREVCRRGFPSIVMIRLMNLNAVLNF
jgi:hypothetical protein